MSAAVCPCGHRVGSAFSELPRLVITAPARGVHAASLQIAEQKHFDRLLQDGFPSQGEARTLALTSTPVFGRSAQIVAIARPRAEWVNLTEVV
jgi:hypothetical protein